MVSHLLFADDMLVHCKGDRKSAAGLNNALHKFHLNTGLAINKQKSKAFFSKGCRDKEDIASILKVQPGCLPIKYSGLPLTSIYPKARHFSSLIDKVRSKVDAWQLALLSFTERSELIKSVLHNTVSYWIFSFKFPNSVFRENFL